MGTANQSCHATMLSRIDELRILKAEQELKISEQYKDLKASFSVGTVLKESVSHIANDKETQKDLVKIAATTGTNFLIEKVLGRNRSIQGFISSILAEKVSGSLIGKLFSKI